MRVSNSSPKPTTLKARILGALMAEKGTERRPALRHELKDRILQELPPALGGKWGKPGRYVFWDTKEPQLGVRVNDKGRKTFVVYKRRAGGKAETYTLGRYPSLSLAEARQRASKIVQLLEVGHSPKAEEAKRAAENARRQLDTFAAAVEKFVKHEKERELRSRVATEAVLRREFLGQVPQRKRTTVTRGGQKVTEWVTAWVVGRDPIWSGKLVSEITRSNIVARLDAIKSHSGRTRGGKVHGGKHAARHALGAVRKLLNWAADGERFGLKESPAARLTDKTIGLTGRDLKRKRVLNDTELRWVWQAAVVMGYPFGFLVQVLLLTGQRVTDIAKARRTEIDSTTCILTVPPERYKTETAQEVPITPRVMELFKSMPSFPGSYFFTTTYGARPLSGLSRMKKRLDSAVDAVRCADGAEPIAPYTLQDMRRTVRTRLVSDCGVDAFIAERVLGHALPGLHGVYDQGTHRLQKRAALTAWETRLTSIVEPDQAVTVNGVILPRQS